MSPIAAITPQTDEHFAPQWGFIFYEKYDLILDADRPITRIDIRDRQIHLARHNSKPAAVSQIRYRRT